MVPFKPAVFIQGHLTISLLSDQPVSVRCCCFQIRAHSTQVPSSHQASSSTGFSCQKKTYDFHLLLAFLRSAGECTEGTLISGRRLRLMHQSIPAVPIPPLRANLRDRRLPTLLQFFY